MRCGRVAEAARRERTAPAALTLVAVGGDDERRIWLAIGVEDTFDQLARLRAEAPVSRAGPGVVFVASRAEARQVLGDAACFGARPAARAPSARDDRRQITLFEEDPDGHGPRRRIFVRAISGARGRRLQVDATRLAEDLLGPVLRRGRCDAVAELAEPLTRQAIGSLLGIEPGAQARVYGLVAELQRERLASRARTGPPSRSRAAIEFRAWALDVPSGGGDPGAVGDVAERGAVSMLREPDRVSGRSLDDDELVTDAQQLCQSGLGATRLLLGNVLLRLATEPGLFAAVRARRDLIPLLVEESLRVDTPVRFARRTCRAPATIGDAAVVAGEEVLVSLTSANRDDTTFDDGEDFDVERERRRHLAFGSGPHRCPGAAAARTIAIAMTEVVADHIDAIRVPEGFTYEGQPFLDGLRFHGPRALPVVLTPFVDGPAVV